MIEIPELGDDLHRMWMELFGLAKTAPAPWVLIGAHMVAVHGWQRGREQIRPSKDADILVNVRAVTDGTTRVSRALLDRGFELEGISPEGIGHRFIGKGVRMDILGPDGVGVHTRLGTVPGAHTVAVPGGTQALQRTQDVAARSRTSPGKLPIPTMLGAILVKVRAIDVDDQPHAQRRDVAFLLSLVDDPDPLVADLKSSERNWLRRHPSFGDPTEDCYRGLAEASDAAIVYRRLTGDS